MTRPPHLNLLRSITLACLVTGSAGCLSRQPSSPPARQADFMDLADNEELHVDDRESQLHGIVTMSKVQPIDYAEYARRKGKGEIEVEEMRGDFVYFAVRTDRCVPFANGSAIVIVMERFKARLPSVP
jgi:hypothetical protein